MFLWKIQVNHRIVESENHRLGWVGRSFKDHLVPTPLPWQGHLPLERAAQSPVQPGPDRFHRRCGTAPCSGACPRCHLFLYILPEVPVLWNTVKHSDSSYLSLKQLISVSSDSSSISSVAQTGSVGPSLIQLSHRVTLQCSFLPNSTSTQARFSALLNESGLPRLISRGFLPSHLIFSDFQDTLSLLIQNSITKTHTVDQVHFLFPTISSCYGFVVVFI